MENKQEKPVNVYLSQRLATTCDAFHLSCLTNKDLQTADKQFVWLEFREIKNKDYPDQNETWDNPDFIFKDFYYFLLAYKQKTLLPVQKEEFKDLYDYLDDDKVEDLIELLETALKLNWY